MHGRHLVRRVGAVATVAVACGPPMTAGSGGEEGVEGQDMGAPACPELVWAGPNIFIHSVDEALALPRYTRIESSLSIKDVPGLVDLDFLECLTEINGDLSIQGSDLESLAGLERLEVVSNHGYGLLPARLGIYDNSKLTSVDALKSLRKLDKLQVYRNSQLESLEPLASLETAQVIEIWGNDSLQTVGLRQLVTASEINIGLAFGCPGPEPGEPDPPEGNASLVAIDGLDSLASFDRFVIAGNPSLISIDGLLHLADASGNRGVFLEYNAALEYEHILDVQATLGYEFTWICSNLDDPKMCECP